MAKGSRLPCTEGVRVGVIPIAFTSLSMGTGEPDTSKVVCPVRGGTGRKGSNDLARGLPYLLRRSRFRQRLRRSVRPLYNPLRHKRGVDEWKKTSRIDEAIQRAIGIWMLQHAKRCV